MSERILYSPEANNSSSEQLIANLIASPREIKTRVIQTFIDKAMGSPVHSYRTNLNY